MSNKHWINGPPEEFEVGMKVEYGAMVGVVVGISGDDARVGFNNGRWAYISRTLITAHCPMMPVGEAEEMVRDAWEHALFTDWKIDTSDPIMPDFDRWWRERRAGDE